VIGEGMSKRLIWNFEIARNSQIKLPQDNALKSKDRRWESRFFWPEDEPIILHGLDDGFLNISRYTIKHRADSYLILDDRNYYFKIRRQQLIYKPQLEQTKYALAYGKKISFQSINDIHLPEGETLDLTKFIAKVKSEARTIALEKEILQYKFDLLPKVTMELARIKINNHIYFSLSIESRVLLWTEYLSQHIIIDKSPSDYVSFLKSIKY
jgi:hypothetical protein